MGFYRLQHESYFSKKFIVDTVAVNDVTYMHKNVTTHVVI